MPHAPRFSHTIPLLLRNCLSRAILPAAAASALALPAFADCQADFAAMVHKNVDAGPYQIESHVQVAEGDKTRAIDTLLKVVFPDALSLSIKNSAENSDTEIVVSGGAGKIKKTGVKDGAWTDLPPQVAANIIESTRKNGFVTDKATNISCLGPKEVGGVSYVAYKYDAPDPQTITLYVDAKKQLPVMAEGESAQGNVKVKSTMRYTYGADIKVAKPQ